MPRGVKFNPVVVEEEEVEVEESEEEVEDSEEEEETDSVSFARKGYLTLLEAYEDVYEKMHQYGFHSISDVEVKIAQIREDLRKLG